MGVAAGGGKGWATGSLGRLWQSGRALAWPPLWPLRRPRRGALAFPLAVAVAALMVAVSELAYHEASAQLDRLALMVPVHIHGVGIAGLQAESLGADDAALRQNRRIALGLSQVEDTLLLNRAGMALLTLTSLMVLGLLLRQRRVLDEQRTLQAAAQHAAVVAAVTAQRDQFEREVADRTAELTALAGHLETAREDERARLARNLHDELGALLTSAKLDVARMRPGLAASAPALLPRLAHLVEALDSGIALKRRIIEDLRPSTLDNLGLADALTVLCTEFADQQPARIDSSIERLPLTPDDELTIFRLVQEALTNIAKHAGAHHVQVTLAGDGASACISVEDDGCGFDPQRVGLARHGLLGMRYRLQAAGGSLSLRSTPGGGTRLSARLPLAAGPVADAWADAQAL